LPSSIAAVEALEKDNPMRLGIGGRGANILFGGAKGALVESKVTK